MPYVSAGPVAAVLFQPESTSSHVVLSNEGAGTVYVGGAAVTAASGLPLLPGQGVVLPVVQSAVYGVSGPGAAGTVTDTLSAAAAAGATALTVASGGASFTAGMLVQVGSGATAEVVTAGSGSTATSIVVSALRFDHASGAAVTEMLGGTGGSVHVTVGS